MWLRRNNTHNPGTVDSEYKPQVSILDTPLWTLSAARHSIRNARRDLWNPLCTCHHCWYTTTWTHKPHTQVFRADLEQLPSSISVAKANHSSSSSLYTYFSFYFRSSFSILKLPDNLSSNTFTTISLSVYQHGSFFIRNRRAINRAVKFDLFVFAASLSLPEAISTVRKVVCGGESHGRLAENPKRPPEHIRQIHSSVLQCFRGGIPLSPPEISQ